MTIKSNNTEQVINDYLQKETNYAIMLTAQWGAGKTHFIRDVVFENLKKTEYKGIIVSLFGITHVDDIKNRILISLYPILNDKYIKGSLTILKTLTKAVDISTIFSRFSDNPIDEGDKGSEALKKLAFDFVDLKKILICFDDLERAKPGMLSSNEVLGYINSLVEDENIKVILIANEGKIEDKCFNEIKEKVIGNTLHFTQEFDEAFESILLQMNTTTRFVEQINLHKHTIKKFLEYENDGQVNYRTLKYFLSYFNPVAHYLHSVRQPDLMADMDNLWEIVLKFMLMISVELKKGEIDFKNNRGLSDQSASVMRLLSPRDKTTQGYNEVTIATYYPENKTYYFYQSLYNYLSGGDIFLENEFQNEIFQQYNIRNEEIPVAYKLLNQLGPREFHKLDDRQHTLLLQKVRTHLIKGAYLPQDLLTVFYYLTRFNNPLRLSKGKLRDDMLRILEQNKHTFLYSPMMSQFLTVNLESENYRYFMPLKEKILYLNKKAAESKQKETDIYIYNLYLQDLKACLTEFTNNHDPYKEKFSLSRISPARFFSRYRKSNNLDREKINLLILICYEPSTGNCSNEDVEFLNSLLSIVERFIKVKTPSNVSGELVIQLIDYIKDRIKKISPYVRLHS